MSLLAFEEADAHLGKLKAGDHGYELKKAEHKESSNLYCESKPHTVSLSKASKVSFVFLEANFTPGRGLAGSHLENSAQNW